MVLRCVEHLGILREDAICIGVLTTVEIRLVVAPVVLTAVSAVRDDLGLFRNDVKGRTTSTWNFEVASNVLAMRLWLIGAMREKIPLISGELSLSLCFCGRLGGGLRSNA